MTIDEFESHYNADNCCCFTGHRSSMAFDENVKARLKIEVENLINKGVTVFLAGGALGFDTVAADTVLSLKGKYPFLKLCLILPCKTQAHKWSVEEQAHYNEMLKKSDMCYYLQDKYTDDCMFRRNEFMVDRSRYCISFMRHLKGGTYYTVSYAKRMGKELIML